MKDWGGRSAVMAIVVASLGYFVDIYDLLLFSILRIQSLKDLGVAETELLEKGVILINSQMAGLLLGGIFWGWLGDKKGRLSVLFGSILIYSLANIANGFAGTVGQYAMWRFIAGIGLAGELGAGITLVAELMPASKRGYGTSIVASFGILGAVLAALVGDILHWRHSYFVGGGMGLLVLLLRVGVHESGLFSKITVDQSVSRGNVFLFFRDLTIFRKYLGVILVGVPLWYVVGILITFSPELGAALGLTELPKSGMAVLFNYLGLSVGDILAGLVSQGLKSRKKSLLLYLGATSVFIVLYFLIAGQSLVMFYTMCFVLGLGCGYWALFMTVAAEQFGTNLRATAATTVPNFVRGSVIPLTMLFQFFKPTAGLLGSVAGVGVFSMALSLIGWMWLKETFHDDLDFVERH